MLQKHGSKQFSRLISHRHFSSSDGKTRGKRSNPVSNYRHAIKNKSCKTLLSMKFQCNFRFYKLGFKPTSLREMTFIKSSVSDRDEGLLLDETKRLAYFRRFVFCLPFFCVSPELPCSYCKRLKCSFDFLKLYGES